MGDELGATTVINRAWLDWESRLKEGELPKSVATQAPRVIPKRPPDPKRGQALQALHAKAKAYGRHYYPGGLEVLTPLRILELKKADLPNLYRAQVGYLTRLANRKAVAPYGFKKLFEYLGIYTQMLLLE
jgi:hypothetical protein